MNKDRLSKKLSSDRKRIIRAVGFITHTANQATRLTRIAELLELPPDEACELMLTIVDWLRSEGVLSPKVIHLKRKVGK